MPAHAASPPPLPPGPVIALLQRVTEAAVEVEGRTVAAIGPGLLVLVGVERGDGSQQARRLAGRLLAYRVFPDAEGRMNRNVADVAGGLLLVPNFTLAADTARGTRASFTPAAAPEAAEALFGELLAHARARHAPVAAGVFGAAMRVRLVNDGPVTFRLVA